MPRCEDAVVVDRCTKKQNGRWWKSVERVFVQRVVPLTSRRAQAAFFTPPTRVKLRFSTALKHENGRKTNVSLSFSLLSLISGVQFAMGCFLKENKATNVSKMNRDTDCDFTNPHRVQTTTRTFNGWDA